MIIGMKRIVYITMLAGVMLATACTDLDIKPKSSATEDVIFSDPAAYKQFLAKIYAGLIISGQQGPAGRPDITGIDEGFSSYLRVYWKLQELTTDEAVITWNDGTIQTLHAHTWTSQSEFVNAAYNRIFYQVSIVNEFLRQTSDAKLSERGVTESIKAEVKEYRAEARFLRALSYFHGMDLFGGLPIIAETTAVGGSTPGRSTRTQLFEFIEQELLAIEEEMALPGENEFGRADQAAVWTLLAKLYLNAEVYTGTSRATDCIVYCKKVLDAEAYELTTTSDSDEPGAAYKSLFRIGNDQSKEIIFYILSDGNSTQTFGGTTFLVHASIGGSMLPGAYGVDFGWGGLRTTSALVDLFTDLGDTRSTVFFTNGQTKNMPNKPNNGFGEGYAVPKFQNVNMDGGAGANATFVDTDFPLFRLADVYLMYAEAILRGGTGASTTPLSLVNEIRVRSGATALTSVSLDNIIDERGRELFWEGHRRTDLIRFGLFTDSPGNNARALWPWKGDVAAGKETETFRDVFPIPSAQIVANPSLQGQQNEGY
jgi:hypothetical protein